MPYRKASSPWMKCALMADAPPFLPRFPLAQSCKQVPYRNPHLCKATSTFPLMTGGPVSGILEAAQSSRAVNGFVRKGRDHDQTSSYTGKPGPGRGSPLQLLRRIAPDCAQFESGLVVGFSEVSGRDWRAKPLSGLSPEPKRPPHRVFCERSHVGHRLAANCSHRPALPPNRLSLEGSRQGTSLVGPSFAARANGRPNDL